MIMTTISNEYRELNAQMHRDMPHYGINGHDQGNYVMVLVKKYKIRTVLDYGAGKGLLKDYLRRYCAAEVQNYDPAIPEFADPPRPAELVVCTDVMEHVEPQYTRDVLLELALMTQKVAYVDVAIRPAKKQLPDGRNAHINLRPRLEWFSLFAEYFDILCYEHNPEHSISFVLAPTTLQGNP